MKLSVHLVVWNGAKYIPYLFESLRKQTFSDWKLFILDNASTDDTVSKIKTEINNFAFEVQLIENKENKGFAGGHNQLYSELGTKNSELFLLLNQDMYLMSDCLEKMVKFMDEEPEAAAVSPRLMRWDFEHVGRGAWGEGRSFSDKIDSLGLKVFRNRRVIEKYTGKEWNDVQPKVRQSYHVEHNAMEVFGVSGAFPMLRSSALKEIAFDDGTLFDSLYNSYKEDVDLAYRLRSAGHKTFVLLDVVAYHDRSAEGLEKKGDRVAAENKKRQSSWIRYHSYKNHLMTLYKNEYWQNWLLDLPWITWYELKKFMWFLVYDRSVLKGLGEIWKNRKEIRNMKLEIREKRKIGWREMKKWWK